jgi:signal transduction histidine kinase
MSRFWKITPIIALATAVVLLIAGVSVVFYGERSYREQKINEVSVQGRILASSVTAALVFNDNDAVQEQVNALKANAEILAAAVYDANGSLIASYYREGDESLPQTAQAAEPRSEDGRLIVTLPVTLSHLSLGTVYLRTIIEPVATRFARYGFIGLLVSMAALLVAILGIAQSALARANAQLQRQTQSLAATNTQLNNQISQREKAEEALRQSQKMEAIGQLSGGIAHDFNNLLTVVKGNLQMLQKRMREGRVDVGQYIDLAMDGLNRASSVTQRILAFSRRQPLSPKPVDLAKLVADMHPLLIHSLGPTISLELKLRSTWRATCDPNQMENVILNLVINARDAMPGGGRLIIETDDAHPETVDGAEDFVPGDYVRLSVIDTGIGMTDEVRRRAIDPFFTTKPIGQGTGLGLSMVFGYIKQSQGHLSIDSAVGGGTKISILMPRHAAAISAGTEPAESISVSQSPDAAVAPAPAPTRAPTVLIVEDEYLVRILAVETLQDEGYDVLEAEEGSAALAMIKTGVEIDLVISDVKLPGISGYQLAESALALRPNLKMMMVTGYAQDPLPPVLAQAGIQVLYKPYDLGELAARTNRIVRERPPA